MSLKTKLSSAITLAFAVVAFTTVASAQDATKAPEDNAQKQERRAHRGEGRRGMHGGKGRHAGMRGMRGLHSLNLTDAQKEQIRAIHEANKPSESLRAELQTIREARKNGTEITAAQRERMKSLRTEMKAKHESVRAQVLAILTPEQRTQLEAKKAEMEKRREEFRQNRQERKTNRDAAKPADKPIDN